MARGEGGVFTRLFLDGDGNNGWNSFPWSFTPGWPFADRRAAAACRRTATVGGEPSLVEQHRTAASHGPVLHPAGSSSH